MTLPDCMMPDGAEPCIGYRELEAERDDYRARWEATGDTRHGAMEAAIKVKDSVMGKLGVAQERIAELEADLAEANKHDRMSNLARIAELEAECISRRDTVVAAVSKNAGLKAENARLRDFVIVFDEWVSDLSRGRSTQSTLALMDARAALQQEQGDD